MKQEVTDFGMAAFLSAHPNIDVDLEHHGSGEIIRAIAAGRGDIGIVGETVDPGAELDSFPFAEIRLVLVTPLRHPLSRHRKIAFRQTLDREFIGFAAGSPMQDLLNYHAFRAGRRFKLRIRLNGTDLMCQMVEKGIGLAILPETAARRSQRSMAIRVIPLTDTWALRQLRICVRSFKLETAGVQQRVAHRHRDRAFLRNGGAPGSAMCTRRCTTKPRPGALSSTVGLGAQPPVAATIAVLILA